MPWSAAITLDLHEPTTWPPPVATAVGPADLVVVRARGGDRLTYLDAVLSQQLRDATPGTATGALELGPNGEPNGIMDVVVLDDQVVLLLPTAIADDVVARLAGRTFLAEVTFTVDTDAAVRRVRGPGAGAAVAAAGFDVETTDVAEVGSVLAIGDPAGVLLVGPSDDVATVVDELVGSGEVADADAATLDALELVAGRPRAPEEVARGRLPEELGLLPTHVHLAKGCYPGQEAVARMWQLGRPRRRLAVLEGTGPLVTGPVADAARPVEVTRAATVADRHVALAFVHRDVAAGDEVAPGVVVRELVGDGVPVPGHDPAVQRRRDRR